MSESQALAKGYALYMSRVDYRDRLSRDDPERRLAQVAVEVAWEMYSAISAELHPSEAASPHIRKGERGNG